MSSSRRSGRRGASLTRREMLHQTLVGAALVGAGGLVRGLPAGVATLAAAPKKGGTLRIGATGGGAKDRIDAHTPVGYPDIARVFALFEPLAARNAAYQIELVLAEEISPNSTGDEWTVRLKPGIEFHNGKTVTADDAIFSLQRIIDPKNPKVGAPGFADMDPAGFKKLDDRTFVIRLKRSYAVFDDQLAQYFNGIVPADYDPKNPVGTGPFKYGSFAPGEKSTFPAHKNYWRSGQPYVESVVIIDFPDDTARVNALLSGQVDAVDNVPLGQLRLIQGNSGLKALIAETGGWLPFTMRVDQAPFDDVRVRQAMRLIANRPQLIDQSLAGQGRVANDLYSPYDPCYAADLPQRHQDLDQAKSLLKAAGKSDLAVELVTAPVAAGIVEAAQVFAEQAKGAGVTVNVKKVDSGVFYGDNYLKWTFAQDFWFTRNYLPQVAQGSLPTSAYNETHWGDPKFISLIDEARATVDKAKRCAIVHEAQKMEYDGGGHIVWGFKNQVDAHSAKLVGFQPAKTGTPLGNYAFGEVSFA
jgi:peptide/nickel transport system substrate-binding protein